MKRADHAILLNGQPSFAKTALKKQDVLRILVPEEAVSEESILPVKIPLNILYEDEDISEMNDDALSDLRLNKICFVFQNFNLLSSETAQENVALPLIYAGIDKEKRNQRAIDVLNKVGLQDRISFKPSQLSGGQKQRVAIARAIINNPKILLADEPTGALDQASGKQVMELFKSLNDEGVTIIMITHDANVASHAKKIFHIIDGEIIENKQGGVL